MMVAVPVARGAEVGAGTSRELGTNQTQTSRPSLLGCKIGHFY